MKLKHEYSKIVGIFKYKFSRALRKKDPRAQEVLLILTLSLHYDLETPKKVSDHLGIPKNQLYRNLQSLSLSNWKRIFKECFEDLVQGQILEISSQSDATKSRKGIQLCLDDSVIRKYGDKFGYLGKWWSGQFHSVVKGLDVIMVVCKVGKLVLPVDFRLLSKADRYANKQERAIELLETIGSRWKKIGISIDSIPVTTDGGYTNQKLVYRLKKVSFGKIVLGGLQDAVYQEECDEDQTFIANAYINKETLDKAPEKQWGINQKVVSKKAYHSNMGFVKLLGKKVLNQVRHVIAIGVYRDCEIYRIWKNHHWVEEVFKRLKSYLHWGKMQLSGRSGAMAIIVIPLLAYSFLEYLKKSISKSTYKLKKAIKHWSLIDIYSLLEAWDLEHFHCKVPTIDQILNI